MSDEGGEGQEEEAIITQLIELCTRLQLHEERAMLEELLNDRGEGIVAGDTLLLIWLSEIPS